MLRRDVRRVQGHQNPNIDTTTARSREPERSLPPSSSRATELDASFERQLVVVDLACEKDVVHDHDETLEPSRLDLLRRAASRVRAAGPTATRSGQSTVDSIDTFVVCAPVIPPALPDTLFNVQLIVRSAPAARSADATALSSASW